MQQKIIRVGFTGTRKGMTLRQKEVFAAKLSYLLFGYDEIEFHHGACMGADVEADNIARNYGCKIHIHPSNDPNTRVNCQEFGDTVYPAKPPLVRDQDIVDAVEVLIAAPKTECEVIRSGTWTTVRKGRRKGITVEVMKP
jgi:hypothetical protein